MNSKEKWAVVCGVFNNDQCLATCKFLQGSPDSPDKSCKLVGKKSPLTEECPQFEEASSKLVFH